MVPWLGSRDPFPPLDAALREPNGLLAVGGSLSPRILLDAYSRGIFPWFSEHEPVMWWSPDPRMVLRPADLHVSRSLAKRLRRRDYTVRADSAFSAVMRACAEPRPGQPGTWITRRMMAAYSRLHEIGYAHSIETWMDDRLAGGLYGVSIGRVFFGESMFTRVTDASKIAFVTLVRQLAAWGIELIDCQMRTPHLASLGAHEIPRAEFARQLERLVTATDGPHRGRWTLPGKEGAPA
jgi:leucyl/phenylalanyl-tRNA--protein transferase